MAAKTRPTTRAAGAKVSDELKARYINLRFEMGVPRAEACRRLGVSVSWGYSYEQYVETNAESERRRLREHLVAIGQAEITGPKALDEMSDLAKACLEDFELFRATVFGRRCNPWAADAAHRFAAAYDSDDREYIVVNVAPGAGKSTLFTNDISAWITCRRRTVRGVHGSVRGELAVKYVGRLRREFERITPLRATAEARDKRGALDATHTMSMLYGRFRAPSPEAWRREYFTIERVDSEGDGEKEYTWTYASMAGDFIGDRVDLMFWDDAVTTHTVKSETQRAADEEVWDNVIEPRLEPGGVLGLVGQRLHQVDLYRHNINKLVELEAPEDDEPERVPQYHHIVYRAHDEDRCEGEHTKQAKPWHPDPEKSGCLLEPAQLPWRELQRIKSRSPHTFELVYNQNDTSHSNNLVQRMWIDGGRDKDTGEIFPGCWDDHRAIGQIPEELLRDDAGRVLSYAMVDPSASNYWVVMWVLDHVATERRYLIDIRRERMAASNLLDLKPGTLDYSGIMEDWQQRSMRLGHRISHWVLEQNSQQKHFMQYSFSREWASMRQVQVIGHETQNTTKANAELGVEQTLPKVYRYGLIRLPGTHDARLTCRPLVDEVTAWPYGVTNDAAMCQWFGEYNRPTIVAASADPPDYRSWRPSWMTDETPEDYGLAHAQAALARVFG